MYMIDKMSTILCNGNEWTPDQVDGLVQERRNSIANALE